ncbi:peptidase T [Campylobacter sp.]|uniref:peptidase T n=1 Tax=Campylobacter sp. TaxID=205 RepID=UPI0026DD1655|nr:peptidase T [Campylobacter sp.]MDO4674854.1 peptidase T [Campylobacter sp.]
MQLEKFFRYVNIASQSDARVKTLPSSEGQYALALMLKKELEELGLSDILLQENAILTARLAGNSPKKSLGFCAHLDTVDVGLSPAIKPQILKFVGKPLCLNAKRQIFIDPKERPELLKYLNEDIIFSDGTSVLGADNKAAIATIMTLLEFLVRHNSPRGDIWVSFVPDEEIGLLGSKALDLNLFKPDFAYTIDCCALGEFNYETFNAAQARIEITGISAHPMNAKGLLLNPVLIAMDLIACFDRLETPENTEGRQGYIWVQELFAHQSRAQINLSIRDHDRVRFEERKDYVKEVLSWMQKRYPKAHFFLDLEDSYANIKESMNTHNEEAIRLLERAFELCGVEKKPFAMRGGTDGSALSAKGLFTPNFFTGAHNFHCAFEFLPLSSFYKSFEVAKNLVFLS